MYYIQRARAAFSGSHGLWVTRFVAFFSLASAIDDSRLSVCAPRIWRTCPGCGTARMERKSCLGSFGESNLVDPASSHMLVSKIKPCMSKYKFFTAKL